MIPLWYLCKTLIILQDGHKQLQTSTHASIHTGQLTLYLPWHDPRICYRLLLLAMLNPLPGGVASLWHSRTTGDVAYNNYNWLIGLILPGSWLSPVSVSSPALWCSTESLTAMLIETCYCTLMDGFFLIIVPIALDNLSCMCVQAFITIFFLHIIQLHCLSIIDKEFKKATNTLTLWCGPWGIQVISGLMPPCWYIIY